MIRKRLLFLILGAMHGIVLMGIIVFQINAEYEDALSNQIISKVINKKMSDEEKVITLLHTTHNLLKSRLDFFLEQPFLSPRETLFRSFDTELVAPKGGCGSFSVVLGRLLQRADFHIRMTQMLCESIPGEACHVLVEVKLNGYWVVLDPLYDLYFRKINGELASFEDVSRDWQFFISQAPNGYNKMYSYESARYTNWQKIPVIMPMIKSVLHLFIGDEVETLSIRSYALNTYRAYEFLFVFMYLLFVLPFTYCCCKSGCK